MHQEVVQKEINPINGFITLFIGLVGMIGSIFLFVWGCIMAAEETNVGLGVTFIIGSVILFIVFLIVLCGLKVVKPNEALVLTLFGNYYGTILKPGFFFVNPFVSYVNPVYQNRITSQTKKVGIKENSIEVSGMTLGKKTVSLKSMTLDNGVQKVNDVQGNPIIIGAVVIWKVVDPTKAVFNVEDYAEFLSIQADSTIRNIARLYPYDDLDQEENADNTERTLRGSSVAIANDMKEELDRRVACAGLDIEEIRITHLAYSEEIAAAMLQRQQANAIIAARQKIVDGAVGMVKMAIDKLGEEEIVLLDEERKAQMVSNLLVVLCSNKDTQPIVNSGSIY